MLAMTVVFVEQEEDVSMTESLAPFANGYRPDVHNSKGAIEWRGRRLFRAVREAALMPSSP
jgi:hypothetical protein